MKYALSLQEHQELSLIPVSSRCSRLLSHSLLRKLSHQHKGYSVKFLNTVSVGEHKLRFVQKTGIKIVPRDTTIYAIVKCGEITTVDFR